MHRPGKSPIEYLESPVDFVGLDGDRRGNAEDAEAAADDAGHHAELEGFAGGASAAAAARGPRPRRPRAFAKNSGSPLPVMTQLLCKAQTSSPPRSGGEER